MNNTLGDSRGAQAPSHRQCLLPSVARTPSVAEVTPAKKITFLKQGDPKFAGIRLAVHQRTFKTFHALMDELSQRMPLPFGVRSVTTPQGLHGLSALEQLQDGGYYLCSDKRPPKTPREPGRPRGRSPSVSRSQNLGGGCEVPGTSSSWKGPAPRKMTLVKNGDPRCQQTVVLSHRNTRHLSAFLSKASELLQFPVKQVYTVSGKKVDSLQTLLHGPSVLVCAGNEAFGALPMGNNEGVRTGGSSGLTARSGSRYWGPKAKQSVIHSRSKSERSGPGDQPVSGHRACAGPFQDTLRPSGGSVAADMEKKVCVNEDGSLSVEMEVRLQLLSGGTLQRSRRVGCARTLTAASGEGQVLGETGPRCCRQEGRPWGFPEPGARELGPSDRGCQGAFDGSQQAGPRYDIWKNPLTNPQGRPALWRRRRLAQLSHSTDHWSQDINGRKRHSKHSISLASNPDHPKNTQIGSYCPQSPEGVLGSDSPCPASSVFSQNGAGLETGEVPCPEGTGLSHWGQHGSLEPETRGMERAFSDASASTVSHEESGGRSSQHHTRPSRARPGASQRTVFQGDSSCVPTLSPSSLSPMDLQTEKHRQGTRCYQTRGGPVLTLPPALGYSGSQDEEGDTAPPPFCAPAQQGRSRGKGPASAVCSPRVPDPFQAAQRGHVKLCDHCGDTQCPRVSPTVLPVPVLLDRGRACPDSPQPQSSPSAGDQAPRDPRWPCPGSLDSQDPPAAQGRNITPTSDSDCVLGLCPFSSTLSAEPVGDEEHRAHSPDSTAVHAGETHSLGHMAESTPGPSSSSVRVGRWPEEGESRAHRGCCRPWTAESPVPRAPSSQMQTPFSETCCMCRSCCPAPPEEGPCTKQGPSSDRSLMTNERAALGRVLLAEAPGARGSLGEEEEGGDMTPSALPSTSPGAVVREWLGSIPEEPGMTYEPVDEVREMANNDLEGSEEDPGDNCFLKGLKEQDQDPRGGTDEHPEPSGALPETGESHLKSEDGLRQDSAPGEVAPAKAEAEMTAVCCDISLRELPGHVSVRTQLMKALLGSRQGRPSSLPEISSPVALRLSHSARALLACLARHRISDEDLGSLVGQMWLEYSPQYQELRSTVNPGGLTSRQALPGAEDFTPTSSSGVDVSSGSGGSGEGSGPCTLDRTLVPKKMELPLKTTSQRPDSRAQRHTEVPGRSSVSSKCRECACASSTEESGDGRAQGSVLEQFVDRAMQEKEVQSEKTEQIEGEGVQGEAVQGKGRPEGEGVSRQKALGLGSQDGEESPQDTGVQEEEVGRDAASEGPHLSDQREEPAASPPPPPRDRGSNATQSVHKLEPGLEGPPRAPVMDGERAQARFSPGTGETSTPVVCRVPLDPDPIWVSQLLRKIEEVFMAHLAGAGAQLPACWSLQDHSWQEQMAAQLEQDVGQQLQASIDKEFQEIQSRARRVAPVPPRGVLWGQTSLQTKQRRRRLQGLHNLSAVPGWRLLSLSLEDGPTLTTALGTRPGVEATGDAFCPCEACVRKQMTPLSPKDTTAVASAPFKKAFDLQHILQSKKECRDGEETGVPSGKTGAVGAQEDPRTVQGAYGRQRLRLASETGEEGGRGRRQKLSREEASGFPEAEEAGSHKLDGWEIPTCTMQGSEGNMAKKEGASRQSSGDGDAAETPGRLGDSSQSVETLEATGQPEAEHDQGENENSPKVSSRESQTGEASEVSSPSQGGGRRPRHGRPDAQSPWTARGSSSTWSLDNCSRISQKGSEEDCPSADLKCVKAKDGGVLDSARTATTLYPESFTSEQEKTPSGPRTPEQGAGKGCDVGGTFACYQVQDRVNGFGQDDFDF